MLRHSYDLMIVQYKFIYVDEDFTWRSQPILAETSKYKSKECSGKKVKLFSFVVIFTYVNIFSYSSKNICVSGGGPGACLGISGGGSRKIDR